MNIEQAREVAADMRSGPITTNKIRNEWPSTIDALIAELERIKGQEPYGYAYKGIEYHTKGKHCFSKEPSDNVELRWWTPGIPLYLAAGAVVKESLTTQERKPLHQEHVFQAYEKALGQTVRTRDESEVLRFARAIEAAHGIR